MHILNIPLFSLPFSEAVKNVLDISLSLQPKTNRLISATGAHGLIYAQNNKNFAEILENFYINLPDGMPGVWIGRLKGAKEMERCYGPDFLKEIIIKSADKPIRHFFCGGKEGVAEDLRFVCEKKYGNKNVSGTYSPPFREMTNFEFQYLADRINKAKADIVWIGLSTPKQELFAKRLAEYTNVHFIITVGAAFDFHTGKVKQAPKFLQKSGLEWLFRLIAEPKRLYKRYMEVVPLFIYYNLVEFFSTLINKKLK